MRSPRPTEVGREAPPRWTRGASFSVCLVALVVSICGTGFARARATRTVRARAAPVVTPWAVRARGWRAYCVLHCVCMCVGVPRGYLVVGRRW